jgi:MFS family permease
MNDPAWQAITPEVVSDEQLASAVALNSAGFNVARAVGPALGGLVVAAGGSLLGGVVAKNMPTAAAGAGLAFLVNAASFLGVIIFLVRWKRRPHENPEPATRVMHSIEAGLRYVRHSRPVISVLVRTGAFSVSAAALWAMLPLIAREHGSIGYGILLACLGSGAVAGAALLPSIRRTLSMDAMVVLATALYAAVTCAAGWLHGFGFLCAVLFAGGVAWISILASLNFCAQTMSPAWVRARSIAAYLLVLQGGLAGGSVLWGAVAQRIGIPNALLGAALALVVGLAVTPRHRLGVPIADKRAVTELTGD